MIEFVDETTAPNAETPDDDDDEPDTPDDDDAQADDEEDEPEARAPELPKFNPDTLEKEQRRHDRELAKVFGSLDPFDPCGNCGGLGIVPKGLTGQPEVQDDPQAIACDTCKGHGVLRTGSLHEQYAVIACVACTGRGYQDRQAVEAARRAAEYAAQPMPAAPPPPPTWDNSRGCWVDTLGNPLPSTAQPGQIGYPL